VALAAVVGPSQDLEYQMYAVQASKGKQGQGLRQEHRQAAAHGFFGADGKYPNINKISSNGHYEKLRGKRLWEIQDSRFRRFKQTK
jgi:hypothetical protein